MDPASANGVEGPARALVEQLSGPDRDLVQQLQRIQQGQGWRYLVCAGRDPPLACFAGIWTNWTSVRKIKEGETTNDSFAFLTTEPNTEVGAIHFRIVTRGLKQDPAPGAWCFAQAGGTGGQSTATPIWNPCSVVAAPERMAGPMDSSRSGAMIMMLTRERRPAVRTLRGWAITLLREAGAIRECDEHGWMQDRADPHARERALHMARRDPPPGVSPDSAAAEVRDVLDSIGDTCPECPPQ